MRLMVLLGVALIWGQLSTHFFFRSWISFLGAICCFIGLFRRLLPGRHIVNLLFAKFTETIFFSVLLIAGFYILYYRLECGKNQIEVLVYFISAITRLVYVLPRISSEIDEIWRKVNGPDI